MRALTLAPAKVLAFPSCNTTRGCFETRVHCLPTYRLCNIFTRTLFHALQVFDPTSVPIQTVTYSLTVTGNTFTTHVARPAVGGSVTVETATPVAGTVVITVDQSARTA